MSHESDEQMRAVKSGKRGRNRESNRSRESERRKGKRRWLSWGTMWRQKLLRMIHSCEWEEYVAVAATQRPKADRQHRSPTDRCHTSIKWTHKKKTTFSCTVFFSTVFIQMSETLPVTKMTLNEQHCTMNKRVICQLFFGFRDNYTERLTCHHKEEKRHGGQKRRKRNCSTQRRKKKN